MVGRNAEKNISCGEKLGKMVLGKMISKTIDYNPGNQFMELKGRWYCINFPYI